MQNKFRTPMNKNNIVMNFIFCWLGWGIPMGLLCSVLFRSIFKGLLLGIVGGLLFAGMMTAFLVILSARKNNLLKRFGIRGTVQYDGPANHYVNKKAIGGWIFLMEDRFCFAPHAFNYFADLWSVPYSEIAEAANGKKARTITLRLRNGETHDFIVNYRNEWVTLLKRQIQPMQ